MGLDIPRQYERQILQVAEEQRISSVEAVNLILQAGLDRLTAGYIEVPVSYVSLSGAAQGPGVHKTREEVDRYLAELRDEW